MNSIFPQYFVLNSIYLIFDWYLEPMGANSSFECVFIGVIDLGEYIDRVDGVRNSCDADISCLINGVAGRVFEVVLVCCLGDNDDLLFDVFI